MRVQRRQGQRRSSTTAGWKQGRRRHPRQGRQEAEVRLPDLDQPPRQKTQAIVKQACQKAGIEIELKSVTASVFFSSDVANPDTYPQFYCRPADVQQRPRRSPTRGASCASSARGRSATKDNKWQGRNITRWQNEEYDDIHKAAQVELDPVKRAAMLIKLNELVGEQPRRDPGGGPAGRRRRQQQARRAS